MNKHTIADEINELRRRLTDLVEWLNDDDQWEPALRAQLATVAVDAIYGDFDSEREYPQANTKGQS